MSRPKRGASLLQNLLRPRTSRHAGERLYAAAVDQARRPGFYTEFGVPDRIDARFELYTLHVLLLTMRLRSDGEAGHAVAQDLFDAYVSALDNALRELGVGDISMSRKMRTLGEALYGRMSAYAPLLESGDSGALAAALGRNVLGAGHSAKQAASLAAYALRAHDELADQSFGALIAGRVGWPEAAA